MKTAPFSRCKLLNCMSNGEKIALLPGRSASSLARGGYTAAPDRSERACAWPPCRSRSNGSKATHPVAEKERKKEERLWLWCSIAIFGFLGFGTLVYTFAYPLVGYVCLLRVPAWQEYVLHRPTPTQLFMWLIFITTLSSPSRMLDCMCTPALTVRTPLQ